MKGYVLTIVCVCATITGISLYEGNSAPVNLFINPAQAAVTIDESAFYTRLSPYGHWVGHARFGWVWYPSGVSVNWQPYTQGQWVESDDFGWTWVSLTIMNPGAGLLTITDAGTMIRRMAGCGFQGLNGGRHGWIGEPATILSVERRSGRA